MPNGLGPTAADYANDGVRHIKRRLDIMERDMTTLREKIARLAERDTCDDCHNHMPGLNRSQQQLP